MAKRKFTDCMFWVCGRMVLAFSKDVYTEQEAIQNAKQAFESENILCRTAYVHHGFGTSEDGERENGYWLHDRRTKNSFPVWCCEERLVNPND